MIHTFEFRPPAIHTIHSHPKTHQVTLCGTVNILLFCLMEVDIPKSDSYCLNPPNIRNLPQSETKGTNIKGDILPPDVSVISRYNPF